jgi:hypothetical protein
VAGGQSGLLPSRSGTQHQHEQDLERLAGLGIPAILSSRPVWNGARPANEAFALEAGGVRPVHRKQAFSNEPGWFEGEWYAAYAPGGRLLAETSTANPLRTFELDTDAAASARRGYPCYVNEIGS